MIIMTKKLIAPLCVAMLLVAFMPAAVAAGAGGDVAAATYYPISRSTRYLAEGCTRAGFETWLTVANLEDGTQPPGYRFYPWPPESEQYWKLIVTYTTNEGVVATKEYDLPKLSRITINVNAEIGAGYDVAFELTVETNACGVKGAWVERPMYFSYGGMSGRGPWQGGHVNAETLTQGGYQSLPTRQYFAEGTTRQDSERCFEEWICVFNPSDTPAQLTFNYMIEGEGLVVRKGTVAANHRATWYVPDHVGVDKDVSLELVSDIGVLAERSMYFSYRSVNPQKPGRSWYGGHVITGVPLEKLDPQPQLGQLPPVAPVRTFAFAPVAYVPGMGWADTWVCFQNPNETEVPVKLTFSTPGGLMAFVKWLPAQQRSTFYYPALLAEYGVTSSRDPGAFRVETVEGYPKNILVERPLYMEFDRPAATGQTPSGGTVISGSTHTMSIYAEGYTGAGFDTWVALTYFDQSQMWLDAWARALTEEYLNSGTWFLVDCYFPGKAYLNDYEISVRRVRDSGYQGPWGTYMWHVNDDFPATEISLQPEQRTYSERIMIFSYMGKWCGMHSSGVGCRW